ncbi:beta-mannosidase [Ophiocordyceps sinensis CO18]|uniref:Beta-mannosidase B n=1 Tax=Ophiocordyceps sinensis (strain Co18 / CGMCC 3.14243) TaxID=911162 RepID=T5AJB2_OPHSC|nr:beta-mannosidase [Ophiocordyceps sinensis CO18]
MAPFQSIPIDQEWHFKQADHKDSAYLPVSQFPTQIHLDLLHHKLIPDPFIGKNELDVQWVGEKPWIYKTTFATPALHGRATAELVFEGLDTFASVVLNGKTLLETDNMFIPQRVNVTDVLQRERDNELVITFDVAYFRGWSIVDRHPQHKWGCWNGDVSRLAVRKAQYHWGWDWGPMLLTCGPWRPVHLDIYTSRLADLHVQVDVDDSLKSANVVTHASIEGPASKLRFHVCLGSKKVASATADATAHAASATFKVQNPELWYPIRYGKQPLYTITATLLDGDEELDSLSKNIGLRKIQLIQRPVQDQPGTSFFFQVNNIPIFCGGSNWPPADSFVARTSRQRYRDWIRLVAEGNQFMIRVWGGGIYEEQAFYDACDETGILVWHDFMFGCGNYPAHPDFLASVEREARENVKRLRHHPSIVVWAGNNEDYSYAESERLNYNPDDMNPENWLKSEFPARYIYEKILPDVCAELVPSLPYRPGCPWGGRYTRDPTVGDIHQWNVWHGTQEKWQDFDKLVGRFVSEFGMEAFPSIKTIDEAFLPQGKDDPDRYPQSSTVDFHNKAAGHARRIALYLVENFRYAPDPIEHFVYCTQLMQAECLASAYRLWKREWRGPGREYCSGALVWQINDCWPVTSWSICDYYLRPKLAYYTVKREMMPLSVGIKRLETTHPKSKHSRVDIEKRVTVEAWGSNLGLDDIRVDCVVKAWDVETGKETYSQTVSSQKLLAANRSTELFAMNVPVPTRGAGLEARTVVAAYLLQGGTQVARYVNWPEPLKYLHLQKPKHLRAELSDDEKTVRVSAEVPVKGLALECEDDEVGFDDNLLDIVPGETVSIGVRGASKKTAIKTQYLGMLA